MLSKIALETSGLESMAMKVEVDLASITLLKAGLVAIAVARSGEVVVGGVLLSDIVT